jgi:hypothetical protein
MAKRFEKLNRPLFVILVCGVVLLVNQDFAQATLVTGIPSGICQPGMTFNCGDLFERVFLREEEPFGICDRNPLSQEIHKIRSLRHSPNLHPPAVETHEGGRLAAVAAGWPRSQRKTGIGPSTAI